MADLVMADNVPGLIKALQYDLPGSAEQNRQIIIALRRCMSVRSVMISGVVGLIVGIGLTLILRNGATGETAVASRSSRQRRVRR